MPPGIGSDRRVLMSRRIARVVSARPSNAAAIRTICELRNSATLRPYRPSREQSCRTYENRGADEGDDDGADESAAFVGRHDEDEEQRSSDAAEDPDQDVTNQPVSA